MAKVLYITAHPLTEEASYSLAAGNEFLNSYKATNPSDEIVHIDLFKEYIPFVDADVFSGWGKLGEGKNFAELTEDEQKKVGRLNELSEQFNGADKYVFVTPLWNFSFPPVMKAYLDAVAVAGKAFKYTEEGPIGLLTDKKALHIQARGGVYSEGPAAGMEMGHRFIETIMAFFGVPTLETLFIEGHNAMPDKAAEIKEAALKNAKELGTTF
ncbi:FMN-dependent NADH-azoreductase [Paenalkalicoccus suaedae]|uniref:FMN dependent NADH:quinone oxidoreductase n=1 Tax=Paenalkalicoccus suaedae TaxID=2592382 RepID=A0A859FBA1_9BACI|nr:FMN-dependent NADH-azoreductase [Paenalkalicoccus suaedae]QKS70098.1 FMN-dependent NADH-azoreductase [Paenalkalicoccus suaedae]